MTAVFTRRYETHKTLRGFCFTFYCDLCDGSVTTPEYQTDAFEEALSLAQSEARRQFNMCHQCGRWICDEHYNEDEMQCIACAPRRERRRQCGSCCYPAFPPGEKRIEVFPSAVSRYRTINGAAFHLLVFFSTQ